jgi:hypothetical protein
MKTILFILPLLFAISCSDDMDKTIQDNAFVGDWFLSSINYGMGPTINYTSEDIIWEFNADNTLDVTLNITALSILLNQNGSYSYNVISNDSIQVGNGFYSYVLEEQTLQLFVDPESDGNTVTFSKL